MKITSRFSLMTAMLLLVLILSAALTVPVYADDGVPPPDETPAEVTPPAEDSAPVVEPAPSVEESAPVIVEETVAEIIEQLPENTELVVLDAEGQALPLASEEAAEVIVNGDPMWCPVGVTPGGAGCSGSFTTFNQDNVTLLETGLLNWLSINQPTTAGVIWIASGYNSSLETGGVITLDGGSFTSMDNFALTINGGWSGGNNTTIVGTSTFTVPLSITGWTGAITINNINITSTALDITSDQSALLVTTNGTITLNNVNVQDNADSDASHTMTGATLNNSGGTGNVVINNSSFNGNTGDGLVVSSKGTVTTKNIVASDNDFYGAYIDNDSALTDKAVTMTGIQQFNTNGSTGLYIESDGQITLANVAANGNGSAGVYLNNQGSLGKLGVTINGSSSFSNNNGTGLTVYTYGNVLLNSITASGNGSTGVYVDNCDYNIGCQIPVAKTVKLTGTNVMDGNNGNGLEVYSYGAISVNNITAINNNGDGAHLDNDYFSDAPAVVSPGTITLTGYGVFNNNSGDGLEARSRQNFMAANLTANNNGTHGIYLSLYKAATLTGTNTFNHNTGGSGLYCDCYGKVAVSNITANDNQQYGAYIDARLSTASTVTLTGVNTFNNNLTGSGLYVWNAGVVTLSNVTANNNGDGVGDDYGAYIYNWELTEDITAAPGVTLSGTNNFNDNDGYGLYIGTYGAILVNNLTANGNTLNQGAYLENFYNDAGVGGWDSKTPKPVTLTGYVHASDNADSGVYILSWGLVSLTNVIANDNGGSGIEIDNAVDPTPIQPNILLANYHPKHTVQNGVTISGTNMANHNTGNDGFTIDSYGAILINNLTANNNSDSGIEGYNDYSSLAAPKPFTFTGYVTTNDNGYGVYVGSNGAILMANVTANGNTIGDGVYAYNNNTGSTGNITLTGVNTANDNSGVSSYGFDLYSNGAIVLSKITANWNGLYGVYIDNSGAATPKPVTISGYLMINHNGSDGMDLYTNGAVTLANITANDNGGYGAYIEADYIVNIQLPVTISGINTFNNNVDDGLYLYTYGAVVLSNITANDNGGYGIDVDNDGGTLVKLLTINGYLITNGNVTDGARIYSDGAITLKNITANDNGEDGVEINQGSATKQAGVTISGVNSFNGNLTGDGLYISNYGAILLSNITANGNGNGVSDHGVEIDNTTGAGAPKPVTITGYLRTSDNFGNGTAIDSDGLVTIANITANDNGQLGVYIQNEHASQQGVTLSGSNTFNDNGNIGLHIIGYGTILVNSVTANDNGNYGVSLDNAGGVAAKNITLTGVNFFMDNLSDGLTFVTDGAAAFNRVTASGSNDGAAGFPSGITGTAAGSITFTCLVVTNNEGSGYNVTGSTVTIKGFFSYGNGIANSPATITYPCALP